MMSPRRAATLSLAAVSLAGALPAVAGAAKTTATAAKTATSATTSTGTSATSTTGTSTTAATATTGAAPSPTLSATQVTIHHKSGNRTAAVALLVAVGLLLAIAALTWAIVTWRAEEPEWLLRARHATGEAGWRISNTWAEFVDFLRLGR